MVVWEEWAVQVSKTLVSVPHEFPRSWMNLIPLVLALLVNWRETAPQLPLSITLSVVSFTWSPRGLGAVPENVGGQVPFPSPVPPRLDSCFMDPTDLQGPGQKWTGPPQIWSPLILSELYRLPLPSSLAGERGGPREGSNLLRTCGRGTLPLHAAALLAFAA